MIKFSTGNGNWVAVEVPTTYRDSRIVGDKLEVLIEYPVWNMGAQPPELESVENDVEEIQLPKGDFVIVGIAQDLTEEEAEQIVDCYTLDTGYDESDINGYYINYTNPPNSKNEVSPDTAFEGDPLKSFASLLRAHSIPSNNLILKVI